VAANATLGRNAVLNATADASTDNVEASGISKNSTRDTLIVPNKDGVKKNVTITRSLTNITVSCPNATNSTEAESTSAGSTVQVNSSKSAVKTTPALANPKVEASLGEMVHE